MPPPASADYIEDCPVCCRPIELHLRTGDDGDFEGLRRRAATNSRRALHYNRHAPGVREAGVNPALPPQR